MLPLWRAREYLPHRACQGKSQVRSTGTPLSRSRQQPVFRAEPPTARWQTRAAREVISLLLPDLDEIGENVLSVADCLGIRYAMSMGVFPPFREADDVCLVLHRPFDDH